MKKNIALVTGGFSGEAVISYKSAITIQNNIGYIFRCKWIFSFAFIVAGVAGDISFESATYYLPLRC